MDEGFYPPDDWPKHAQVFHCALAENRDRHDPHYWVPSFIHEDDVVPDFICGGWPRKVIAIDERR